MTLSVFQILSINAILVPALIALWTLFMQRGVIGSLAKFKAALKGYEKQKARNLLERIKEVEKEGGKEEEMIAKIADYTDDWTYVSDAVVVLNDKEDGVHKWAKLALLGMVVTFIFGLLISGSPDVIVTGSITRLGVLYFLFFLEILAVGYWIWLILDFGRILAKTTGGQVENIEKIIKEVVKDIKESERRLV